MTWLRLTIGAFLLTTAVTAVTAGSAAAQSNAERANQLNEEGKQQMTGKNFALASERFHQAILLSREGRFYFNLCVSEFYEGKLVDSLEACTAVDEAGADGPLQDKTAKMTAKVKDEMRKQGYDPDAPPVDPNAHPVDPTDPNSHPVDPTDPNSHPVDPTDPNSHPVDPNAHPAAPPPVFHAPPADALTKAAAPDHHYTWTLGFELLGASAAWGRADFYTKAAFGFRFLGDYLLAPSKKIGLQATIGVLHSQTDDSAMTNGIDVVDIGIGAYKHFCGGRTCFTPIIGPSLGLMQPKGVSGNDALLAIGVRAEGRLGFALGTRFEHLISLSVGFQGYTKAFDSSSISAESQALDKGSAVFVVALGYTYRFNTPFGSSPMFNLE